MKRASRWAVLLFAPALLFANEAQQSCPMGGLALASPRDDQQRMAWHKASVTAESVAPTAVVSGGRQRIATPPPAGAAKLPTVNFIDTDLFAAQKTASVVPTALSTDEEFLRRITLDLTGQIPDSATVLAFTADKTTDKRSKKIDELLASDAFVDRWTLWFGDLVENVSVSTNSREYYLGRNAYYSWIQTSIRNGKPYDQMVREVLNGSGDNFVAGNADYWVRQIQNNGPIQDTYDNLAAHSGERFLGMQLLCLSCHSGPGHLELVNQGLKTRTRSEFWGMSAFFAKTRAVGSKYTDPANPNNTLTKFDIGDNPNGNYLLNTTSGNKTTRAPATGQSNIVQPVYMFTGEGPRPGEPWRDAYGRILTSDRQFARAAANYLWKEMFGLGIVEPANAFDLGRLDPAKLTGGQILQPTNPVLLEHLTDNFIASGYSLRGFLKTMALSSSYQLSSKYTSGTWNEAWTPLFARHYPTRMGAEMVFDAITKATNVPQAMNVNGMGTMQRAVQLPDPTEPRNAVGTFLNDFGRGDRDESPRRNDSSISQALSLLNNTIVTSRIKKNTANSTVAKATAASSDPATIADQLYLATLSRHPTPQEKSLAVSSFAGGTIAQKAEDLQFALLNQLEFMFK
jgi:hypothetical protein